MVRDKAKEVCKVGTDTSPRMKMFLPLKINVVECVGYAENMDLGRLVESDTCNEGVLLASNM